MVMEQREIKFRGKTRPYKEDDFEYMGEWVYGYYHSDEKGQCYIIQKTPTGRAYPGYPVIKESIGQYTGLKDKNGVEIYEGDIICHGECYEQPEMSTDRLVFGEVKYLDASFCLHDEPLTEMDADNNHTFYVAGNIHENPSLLTK